MVKIITKWLYLEPFVKTDEWLHLADVSRQLKEPHPTVRNYLNYFEKKALLIKQVKGRLTIYRLNKNNPLLIHYLVLVEKERLIAACEDLLIQEFVSFLDKHIDENTKVILFGSSVENSRKAEDLDLIISGDVDFKDKLKDFEDKFNKKIHLINVKNLHDITDTLKKEIIKKHIIINGVEEVIKWLI